MDEGYDPQLAVYQGVELFHVIPVPHEGTFPGPVQSLCRVELVNSLVQRAPHSGESIAYFAHNVLLQRVSQVVSVRKVKAFFGDIKTLEQIVVKVLTIPVGVVRGHEKAHHLCLFDLIDAVLAYFSLSLPLRHHDKVVTFQELDEPKYSVSTLDSVLHPLFLGEFVHESEHGGLVQSLGLLLDDIAQSDVFDSILEALQPEDVVNALVFVSPDQQELITHL